MKSRLVQKLTAAVLLLFAAFFIQSCEDKADYEISGSENVGQAYEEALEDRDSVFGVKLLGGKEIEEAIKGRKKSASGNERIALFFNGNAVPCTKNRKIFYLTVEQGENIYDSGTLTAGEGYEVLTDRDFLPANLPVLISHGNTIMFYVIGETDYSIVELTLTYLPIVTIDFDDMSGPEFAARGCDFAVYNSVERDTKKALVESRAEINIRGGSSASLAKTGLKVALKNEDGSINKQKLLGMRKDDDWILTAMYSDESKVRDMLSWDLWRKMDSEFPGVDGSAAPANQYVEVLMNGRYHGLFLLMERFDSKTLDLSIENGDELFKTKTWDVPTSQELSRQNGRSTMCGALEKKFPKPEDNIDGSWSGITEYVKVCYEYSGDEFKKSIENAADIHNQLDYWLFNNITMAGDNTWKNAYYAYKNGKIYTLPWDLDITFGLSWSGDFETNYLYEEPVTAEHTYDFQCGRRLIKYYDGASEYLQNRFDQLIDDDIASADALIRQAEIYWSLIHDSGAMSRELERWPKTSYVGDLDYLKSSIRRRIDWLEDYIDSLD